MGKVRPVQRVSATDQKTCRKGAPEKGAPRFHADWALATKVSDALHNDTAKGDAIPETGDLRNSPIYEAPAVHLAYGHQSPLPKSTAGLPIGTQARFLEAAAIAAAMNRPLNTLITLRWRSLFSANDPNPLRCLPIPARIDHLVERLRKWLHCRDLPPLYIWVREAAGPEAEHWHIALHVPQKHRRALADFVARLTGEARAKTATACRTEGEFARGEIGSWHLAADTHPERQGYFLAAYLGKGEPSQRLFRGKLTANKKKPVRGKSFGGTQPDGKYDAEQGEIQGTACREDRFFIAKKLQSAQRAARTCQALSRSAKGAGAKQAVLIDQQEV